MELPIVAAKKPVVLTVEPGIYYWCVCGRSQAQPFCDGSHAGTGIEPLEVKVPQQQKLAFCACKQTKTPPFCDGSHGKL